MEEARDDDALARVRALALEWGSEANPISRAYAQQLFRALALRADGTNHTPPRTPAANALFEPSEKDQAVVGGLEHNSAASSTTSAPSTPQNRLRPPSSLGGE